MLVASLCLCITSVSPVRAQANADKVYTVDQVDVPAKIKTKLENFPEQPSDCPAKLHVTLQIVLRKSGNVTDVTVIKSSGCSYDQEAVKAVQKLKFDPAIKGDQQVSQYVNFEYRVGDLAVPRVNVGQIIESVQVIGYRRLQEKDIRSLIKMRPGQLYTDERAQRDFNKILATGLFDKRQTRIVTESGVRGGLVVVIEVVELPLIWNVTFTGLGRVQEAQIRKLFRAKRLNLVRGAVYDPVKVRVGQRVTEGLLANEGWSNPQITCIFEALTMGRVSIEFQIKQK